MTVGELIEMLQDYDPELTVLFMSQPSYPFEYSIGGICERNDFSEVVSLGDIDEDGVEACQEDVDNCEPNCVFLTEGEQLRYGDREAWNAARRPDSRFSTPDWS